MKKPRPTVIPCSAFGGRSPKTGKRVGSRHRWGEDPYKPDRVCLFCFRPFRSVLREVKG